ncbi:hypothetical protein GCM10009105_23550 [Dokdonella soli]|uniref:Uncharacterized protein n=1 Tax=Dokdonella soli TaxID=529810 RepID=A0ABP3TVY4_9GAMM
MHGVEAPQAPAVERAMRPVADQVAEHDDRQHLQRGRQLCDRTKAVQHVSAIDRLSQQEQQRQHGGGDHDAGQRSRQQWGQQPVDEICGELAAAAAQSGHGGPAPLQQAE